MTYSPTVHTLPTDLIKYDIFLPPNIGLLFP